MPIVYRKVSISNVRVAIPTAPGTRMSNEWDYLKDGERDKRAKSQISVSIAVVFEIFIKAHKFPFYFNLSEKFSHFVCLEEYVGRGS